MATIQLPPDFKEFFSLLNSNEVRYLLVGGYAVGLHGYVRATADMDVWIERTPENVTRLIRALRAFGFDSADADFFMQERKIARMGVPPLRIELLTTISGVTFSECYDRKYEANLDGLPVPVLGLDDLCKNKAAAGRDKDRLDISELRRIHG
jgi:predicted nucleotidyltransferase